MNPSHLTDTLMGGRDLTVAHADGSTETVHVRQLPLRDYERAWALLEDEIAWTAYCVAGPDGPAGPPRTRAWAESLTPASYEALYAAAREVNAQGFFAWSGRRQARLEAQQARALELLAQLPPEAQKLALEVGSRAATSPTSPPTSPRPQG